MQGLTAGDAGLARDVMVQHPLDTAARRNAPVGAREHAACLFHPKVRTRSVPAVDL